ncbi:MAG: hypothetical protein DHS20C19_06140 [Acidimicrobiales bacterium]|nr:MAG: hypothetical protein DHS20C19_06140 [Acidimicrobiales bacterium]
MTHGGTCLLAENAVEFFAGLQAPLRALGIDLGAADEDDADVLFACGLLTREWIAAGRPFDAVAAPVLPGESAPVYRSVVITRDDGPGDLATAQEATLAVNEYGSWSGWHGYVDDLRTNGLPVPERRVVTGGHRSSVRAVRDGQADVAAVDSSLWRWLPGDERSLVRVIHETADWPAPPISVRSGTDRALIDALLSMPDLATTTTADYDFMLEARTPVN